MLTRLRYSFRAFGLRNYRIFFLGQTVSLVGTWMQRVAMGWLIYRLTDSAMLLGVIGFTSLVPTFFVGPFGGVLADRLNRHRVLIATQSLSMVQAAVLAVITMTGIVEVWHIVTLSLMLGTVSAFDVPVRQAFVVQLVERKEDLGNAIALNSTGFNIARLAGPSLAGLLTAAYGEWLCFLANAVTFGAVILSLTMLRIAPHEPKPHRRALEDLADGVRYVWSNVPIRAFLLFMAVFSLFGIPYGTLMPIFARDILGGGADTLGFLMAAAGLGAIAGALHLAARTGPIGIGRLIPFSAGLFALGIVAFSASTSTLYSLLLVILIGAGQQVTLAGTNTFLQTAVDEHMRGRVMSFYTMALLGMAPFGSLLAGALGELLGAPLALALNAGVVLAGVLVFATQLPRIRQAAEHALEPQDGR